MDCQNILQFSIIYKTIEDKNMGKEDIPPLERIHEFNNNVEDARVRQVEDLKKAISAAEQNKKGYDLIELGKHLDSLRRQLAKAEGR